MDRRVVLAEPSLRNTTPEPLDVVDVAPNVTVSPQNLISEKLIARLFLMFSICVFIEYLSLFFIFSLENVENRPSMYLVAGVFMIGTVAVAIIALPLGIVHGVPTNISYKAYLIISINQLLALIFNILSAVAVFKVEKPLTIIFHPNDEFLRTTIDVTMYLRVVNTTSLILVLVTLSVAILSSYIHGLALYRIANRESRKKNRVELTMNAIRDYEKSDKSYSGDIHEEMSDVIKNSFMI